MINWSKLKPYNQDVHRSFEELCYQVAKQLYSTEGRFTRIDGSGGDDGVEFYLTLGDGSEWGWQAKFYPGDPRLSKSNRKAKITSSLAKSCSEHPRLVKWFLCTQVNFTPSDSKWFDETLPNSVPQGRQVQLEHWGDSEFNEWMSQPRFSGKRQYFFGELELTMDWFHIQLEKQFAGVKKQYNPLVHTETKVDAAIHAVLGDSAFRDRIGQALYNVQEGLAISERLLTDLRAQHFGEITASPTLGPLLDTIEALHEAIAVGLDRAGESLKLLTVGQIKEFQQFDWQLEMDKVELAAGNFREARSKFQAASLDHSSVTKDTGSGISEVRKMLDSLTWEAGGAVDDLLWTMNELGPPSAESLNIIGPAGIGKTQSVSHICDIRLRTGLPALMLRGIHFPNQHGLEERILELLDVPKSYSWHEFLQALAAAAEAYHVRIPLFIDGLNELPFQTVATNLWRTSLPGLTQEIAETKLVALITTCRESYVEAFWPDGQPDITVRVDGFDASDVEEAVAKYFQYYKIRARVDTPWLREFRHPLYLRIFCEITNPARHEYKQVDVGHISLFQTFDNYLKLTNRSICDRLGLHSSVDVLTPILKGIANYVWNGQCRLVPIQDLTQFVDGKRPEDLDWWHSKTHAILQEDLLVCMDIAEGGQAIRFAYDLLGGYVIADYLIQQHKSHLDKFYQSASLESSLFSADQQIMHPLAEDIRDCLALLLPVRAGCYLHDLSSNAPAVATSIRSVFRLPANYINDSCLKAIAQRFGDPGNRRTLLELSESKWCENGHPLNVRFWSNLLNQLPMPERDLSWTEHVRANRDNYEIAVERFRDICENHNLGQVSEGDWLPLAARQALWILTSTVRPLRDKATRALYWYGRRFPKDFLAMLKESLQIDDPYVSERVLAAAYGVAMARQFDFGDPSFTDDVLPELARLIYDQMFAANSPHSTTHTLARDYARRVITVAIIHHPNLLSAQEQGRITPPFMNGGIRVWGHQEDEKKDSEETIGPLQMDFANYTLGTLVEGRSNYDFDNPAYKTVRAAVLWRIYQLGYSLKEFGVIDKAIARRQWQSTETEDWRKTERYGKKYSWIAYYELTGFLEDSGSLPDAVSPGRTWDIDLDPSFPNELQKFCHIQSDFLGDRTVPVEEWIEGTDTADLEPYFVAAELNGEEGPWVLLDGFLRQEDPDANRRLFAFPRSFIVKTQHAEEFAQWIQGLSLGGRWLPEIPEDYGTYAGEIPWSDTFPANEITTIEQPTYRSNASNELVNGGEEVQFEVLMPVRKNCWEQQYSALSTVRHVPVPSREMADVLNLCGQSQTFDLFEKTGQRASVSFEYGDRWHSHHKLVYFRQDLLDRFLTETGNSLVRAVWGEREFYSHDHREIESFVANHQASKVFQLVRVYSAQRRKPM